MFWLMGVEASVHHWLALLCLSRGGAEPCNRRAGSARLLPVRQPESREKSQKGARAKVTFKDTPLVTQLPNNLFKF